MDKFLKKNVHSYDLDTMRAEQYIKAGKAVHGTDHAGNSLLHHLAGAYSSNTETLSQLVETYGMDVNARNVHGETSLHKAIRHDRVDTMGYLIKHSTDVNARDKQGNTPLNIVGNFHFNRSGDDDKITIAQILLDRGVDADHTNLFGYATLYCLAEDNMGRNMDLANLLIDHGTDVNDGNFIIADGGDTVTIT